MPRTPSLSSSWLPAYIVLACIWGSSFLSMKIGLESLTSVGVALVRTSLGAVTLVILSAVRRTPILPPRSTWKHLAVLGLILNTIPFALFAYGETHISSILAGIINAVTPLTTLAVILLAFPEEHPTRERIVGLILGFVGVLVVLGVWRGLGDGEWQGVAACFVAVCCYGIGFPYMRRHIVGRDHAPIALATGQVIFGSLFLVPLTAFNGVQHHDLNWRVALAMLALGCLGSGIAYILNLRILTAAGSAAASTVTYLTPVVAVLLGVAFLDESPHWNEPIGALVVVIGAAIAQGRLRILRSQRQAASASG
jgi:drug/metabolite transporter (DMT)-like permease